MGIQLKKADGSPISPLVNSSDITWDSKVNTSNLNWDSLILSNNIDLGYRSLKMQPNTHVSGTELTFCNCFITEYGDLKEGTLSIDEGWGEEVYTKEYQPCRGFTICEGTLNASNIRNDFYISLKPTTEFSLEIIRNIAILSINNSSKAYTFCKEAYNCNPHDICIDLNPTIPIGSYHFQLVILFFSAELILRLK